MPLVLAVASLRFYSGCITIARKDAFIQPCQFDPEGETPEKIQTVVAAGRFRMVSVSE